MPYPDGTWTLLECLERGYPPCPLCGQSYGMDHMDPARLCLDCQCCADCGDNNRCIRYGCIKEPAS